MEIPYKRLLTTVAHLTSAESDDSSTSNGDNDPFESRQIISLDLCASSKRVQQNELLEINGRHHQGKEPTKWNGWGYEDVRFEVNDHGHIRLTGGRYELCGCIFPKLRPWAESQLGLDINHRSIPNSNPLPLVPPKRNVSFLNSIEGSYSKLSFEDKDRLFHGHGHTGEDIWRLRNGRFNRVPDAVIWPAKHDHVERIVQAAINANVVLIPFGGGTSVTHALECPENEQRMIVSLDMHEMNRIKWIDYESLMACIECGVIGKDLDAKLLKLGLCLGHEPDSSEFSSLGGWIATRASGMKKNRYGNIEDILISAKMVTPSGTLERSCQVPRLSSGPSVNEMILGSEGTLGVITEAVVRLRPTPECQRYGSIIFRDFESGVAFLEEIARQRCAPASIRLMDNLQFQLGQVLKAENGTGGGGGESSSRWGQWVSITNDWIDSLKKLYVVSYLGFDVEKMVAATLLFEGFLSEVEQQEKRLYAIASKFGGVKGGEENGRRGYFLTYMIAYIRDFGFDYYFIAESFETSVPWSNVLALCSSVKKRIIHDCKKKEIKHHPFVSCRVTQTYDTGACVYFYFGFIYRNLPNPLRTYVEIENAARDEILKNGGSLSHHHGIGKLRKQWMQSTVSTVGMKALKGIKDAVDPMNIFGNGNLI